MTGLTAARMSGGSEFHATGPDARGVLGTYTDSL